jgi:hypothetical protein
MKVLSIIGQSPLYSCYIRASDNRILGTFHVVANACGLSRDSRSWLVQRPSSCDIPLSLAVLALMLASSWNSYAAPLPRPFEVEYVLKHGPLTIARMAREFTIMPSGTYRFTSETRTAGPVALFRRDRIWESSVGSVTGNTFTPSRYEYHRGGAKERRVTVTFDRSTGTVEGSARGEDWQLELAPGMMDKLLYQLVLMRDLQEDKRELRYVVADSGRAKTYELSFVGEATITTPTGTYPTISVQRQKSGSERKTTLWCAPELGFLPVRVDYREKDGKVTTALLNSVTVSPAPYSE